MNQGINHSCILIRVGVGVAEHTDSGGPSRPSFQQFSIARNRGEHSTVTAMYPVKVNVSRHVEDDAEIDLESLSPPGVEGKAF